MGVGDERWARTLAEALQPVRAAGKELHKELRRAREELREELPRLREEAARELGLAGAELQAALDEMRLGELVAEAAQDLRAAGRDLREALDELSRTWRDPVGEGERSGEPAP